MIKIGDTEIHIIRDSGRGEKTLAGTTGTFSDDTSLRQAVAGALRSAAEQNRASIAFFPPGCGGSFPPPAAAKILAQEILKTCRDERTSLKEIVVCLADDELFQVFDQTITGYVDHILNDLGKGPYVTVDAIIELPEGIVIIERSNPPFGWSLPGGFVDAGESLEEAVVREAKEETSLDFVDIRQFKTYSDPGRDPRFHTVSTVFIGKGKGNAKSGDDAKDLKIVPYEDLLKGEYAFDHKDIIEEYLRERMLYGNNSRSGTQ